MYGICFHRTSLSPIDNTPIPIKMANKWTGKTIQTRTFTVDEEQSAKNVEDASCWEVHLRAPVSLNMERVSLTHEMEKR